MGESQSLFVLLTPFGYIFSPAVLLCMCDASELLLISWLGESVYMNMLQLLSKDVAIPVVCLLNQLRSLETFPHSLLCFHT